MQGAAPCDSGEVEAAVVDTLVDCADMMAVSCAVDPTAVMASPEIVATEPEILSGTSGVRAVEGPLD